MIKARRKSTTTTGTKKNNAAARATGKNKASRAANLAARRGLATNKKANAMEVEKQVQRQAGRAGAAGQEGVRKLPLERGERDVEEEDVLVVPSLPMLNPRFVQRDVSWLELPKRSSNNNNHPRVLLQLLLLRLLNKLLEQLPRQ